MVDDLYDCIVIGAGPAGLSASLFLARYLRRTLTFHHNSPRNEYAHGIHGFLGHHGIRPSELLARGRDEVTTHGGSQYERKQSLRSRVTRQRGSYSVFSLPMVSRWSATRYSSISARNSRPTFTRHSDVVWILNAVCCG